MHNSPLRQGAGACLSEPARAGEFRFSDGGVPQTFLLGNLKILRGDFLCLIILYVQHVRSGIIARLGILKLFFDDLTGYVIECDIYDYSEESEGYL